MRPEALEKKRFLETPNSIAKQGVPGCIIHTSVAGGDSTEGQKPLKRKDLSRRQILLQSRESPVRIIAPFYHHTSQTHLHRQNKIKTCISFFPRSRAHPECIFAQNPPRIRRSKSRRSQKHACIKSPLSSKLCGHQ